MIPLRLFVFFLIVSSIGCQVGPNSVQTDLEKCLKSARDTVHLFAEDLISTKYNERDMAISMAGDEIFYSLGNYNQNLRAIIRISKKNNRWGSPEILPWSGVYNDIEPFLSPDGNKLFFASNRPFNGDSIRKDFNLWVSTRTEGTWGEPAPIDTVINTLANEYYPAVGKSGNLYFTAAHPGNYGREDIYVSLFTDEKYNPPVPLDSAINSINYEFNAYISPEEDTLIFSSYGRADDLGGGDLYISTKDDKGQWQKARNLGAHINSPALDYCPFIDFTRKSFYFTSNRAPIRAKRIEKLSGFKSEADKTLNGLDNIYQIKLNALSNGQ